MSACQEDWILCEDSCSGGRDWLLVSNWEIGWDLEPNH